MYPVLYYSSVYNKNITRILMQK